MLKNRIDILKTFPKGGIIAELGVRKGDFASDILKIIEPKKLHLVDCWQYQPEFTQLEKFINVLQIEQDILYNNVKKRFVAEIKKGVIILHRKFTSEAVKDFPDNYFDWIYIDADHRYESVFADLRAYLPKLKLNGFFFGDDFDDCSYLGVIPAVTEFCVEEDFKIEVFPFPGLTTNFILRRRI